MRAPGGALVLWAALATLSSSCGAELAGKAAGVSKVIKEARENGAYRCQPKHLTLAEANLRFSTDRLSMGFYHEAKRFLALSSDHAQAAYVGSPPEKCRKRAVEVPEPRRVVVKILDTDGDGIPDDKDKCPTEPEDKDGFQDEDGCPDPDNDGDGICDDHPEIQKHLAKYAKLCTGADRCPGKDEDKANGFKDTKEDKDGFEDEDGCPDNDNDKDGIADAIDKCPNDAEDKDGFEDDDGCPDPDNDKDGICDGNETIQKNLEKYKNLCKGFDKCPNEPETVNGYEDDDGCPDKVLLVKVTKTKIELSQKVFYEYNKARILPKSFQLLKDVATVMKDRPTMEVRIEGHTDSTGSRNHNKRLSAQRADSVRQFLMKEGVDSSRMVSVGYGPDQPLSSNRTETGREMNRRVEFFITKQ
jgi:OOP family OmpA-OmpF porin